MQLFQRRPLQLSIASEKTIILEPTAIYTTQTPVQFRIAALDEFLSPEVFILCEVSIVNGDGSAIAGGDPPTDAVAPTVNFAHSMWQDVEVVINGTLISGRTRLYPYRAYFENIYLTTDQAKNTWLDGTGAIDFLLLAIGVHTFFFLF